MINKLPKELSSRLLEEFYIGNQEAVRDELLVQCYCEIAPVRRFLIGDKDYLLGVKGSGKSAIFRLLLEKKIFFNNKNKLNQIIVPIDQDVDYLSVKYHLKSSLSSVIEDDDIKSRFVWEIYLLYRVITAISSSDLEVDKETMTYFSDIISYFSCKEIPSIIDVITQANRTIGFKLDLSYIGFPSPEVYVSPKADVSKEDKLKSITINIGDIQSKINTLLRKNKAIIYVLIDNLDDFLAREEYGAQRLVVQGLIACSKNYSKYQNIKIKSFLRNEVFHKIEFEKIGGSEKIKPNSISLEWGQSDIRRFIAERFIFNMLERFNFKKISIRINDKDLYERRVNKNRWLPEMVLSLFRRVHGHDLDTTELDKAWREVITCFMPKQVDHYDSKGNLVNGVDLFDYLNTHLCLANSQTTPRAALIYLDKLLQVSAAYYAERLFPVVRINDDGWYPLFLKQHITAAYGFLQEDLKSYISSSVTHPEWKARISSLLTNIGRKQSFSFRELKRLINYDDQDQDAKELLAFLEHLGVLICKNKSVHLPDREYDIPVILQQNWAKLNSV